MEVVTLCKLNNRIIKEAKRLGIDHRLEELHIEYHRLNGKRPKDLVDLLRGAVGA